MLKKYILSPSHVVEYEPIQLNEIWTYKEGPIRIMDRKAQTLRNNVILLVNVLW